MKALPAGINQWGVPGWAARTALAWGSSPAAQLQQHTCWASVGKKSLVSPQCDHGLREGRDPQGVPREGTKNKVLMESWGFPGYFFFVRCTALLLGSPNLIISHLGGALVPKIPFKMENRKVHFPPHVNLSCSQRVLTFGKRKKAHIHKKNREVHFLVKMRSSECQLSWLKSTVTARNLGMEVIPSLMVVL